MADDTTPNRPANEVQKHPVLVAIGGTVVDPIGEFTETLERCSGKTAKGGPCPRVVVAPGATVCRVHGGSAPQVREAAIERLRDTRDMALDRLLEAVQRSGEKFDPRVLLDVVTRLTDKVELLEGRATERTESSEFNLTEIRATFNTKLDDLATSYGRAPMVLDMIDRMMGEGKYAEDGDDEAADG